MRDLATALSKMNDTQQEFERCWRGACSLWSDSVQRTFEHEHLEPIMRPVTATHAELERVLQVVAQARRNVR